MKINLDELNKKSKQVIKDTFLNIPNTEVDIVFEGYFNSTGMFSSNRVAKALKYLPKHVQSVIFDGKYVYTRESESYEVDTHPVGPYDSGTRTEYRYYEVRRIGSYVKEYVSVLPRTVTAVALNFNKKEVEYSDTRTSVRVDLKPICQKFSKNVTHLRLIKILIDNGLSLPSFLKMMPPTIEVLDLFGVALSTPKTKTINSIENRHLALRQLIITDAQFNQNPSLDYLKVLTQLKSLSYSWNQLNRFSQDNLKALFTQILSFKLFSLSLEGNYLSTLGAPFLIELFTILNTTTHLSDKESPIVQLDLTSNGLLALTAEDFKSVLEVLTHIKSLRLSGNTAALTKDALIERFTCCLPKNIDTLRFDKCKYIDPTAQELVFLGRSLEEFLSLISQLPSHIKVLDFSNNRFSKEELISIFSNLPPHIEKVKLNSNGLCGFNQTDLKEIFSHFPKNVTLDVVDNGFEGLPYTERNELLDALPDTLIDFGKTRLNVKGDGSLTNYPQLMFKKIRHQDEFSSFQGALLLLLRQRKADFKILHLILPFLLGTNPKETERYVKLMERTGTYLLESRAVKVTEQECEDVVNARIHALTKTDTMLDLRRCALNKLDSIKLGDIFASVSKFPNIRSLGLRGNGFLKDAACKSNFIHALASLPAQIRLLDVSENRFEALGKKELAALLVHCPESLQFIIFANEKPISPEQQIERRDIPTHYIEITKNTQGLKTAEVLLRDYTKGDSRLARVCTLHWDRNHVEEVNIMEASMKKGKIKNENDVLAEIEALDMNPIGCLGKSWMHLFNQTKINQTKIPAEKKIEYVAESKAISLTRF